jgi:2-polyprenyl-6-methoxyphenol hydroxylase-like FAD-dependent oxidoreductase
MFDRMVDVLVVGAGPTGLVAASELIRHGLSVRVIDRLTEPNDKSRALGIQARSLEILDDLGVADELIARGNPCANVAVFAGGTAIVRASLEDLETRYPYVLVIPQHATEAVLAQRLVALGGRIERGVELVGYEERDGGVVARVRAGGEESEIHAAWLIGCDGAHSTVRKAAGLEFKGRHYDERFALADVDVEWDVPSDQVTTFFGTTGVTACFPLAGKRWRVFSSTADTNDETADPSIEEVAALLAERSQLSPRVSNATWLARFRIGARQVERYRHGRVFVAGDAAHIHSPLGGQGMNTGMQDAHNLAWKLALVHQRHAQKALLDSYHAERHPVAAQILRGTDVATRVATLRNPVARAVRDQMARFFSSFEMVRDRIARNVAELTIDYRKSPIVGEHRDSVLLARIGSDDDDESPTVAAHRRFGAAPHAGQLVADGVARRDGGDVVRIAKLLDTRRHSLLLFDGRATTEAGYARFREIHTRVAAAYGDRIATHVVVAGSNRPLGLDGISVIFDHEGDLELRFGAIAECLYLIRPDLYIAYRSQPVDEAALDDYLASIFVTARTSSG